MRPSEYVENRGECFNRESPGSNHISDRSPSIDCFYGRFFSPSGMVLLIMARALTPFSLLWSVGNVSCLGLVFC